MEPNWPTQPWYTKLMQMITDYPRLFPVQKDPAFGSQALVIGFEKGVCESCSAISPYVETWDVTVVLKFLANLHPPSKLTLRD